MTNVTVKLTDPTGLHARPAALFVQQASKFQSSVKVTANGRTADAKSLLGIMGLGAACGTEVTLSVDGPDEADCIKALSALLTQTA